VHLDTQWQEEGQTELKSCKKILTQVWPACRRLLFSPRPHHRPRHRLPRASPTLLRLPSSVIPCARRSRMERTEGERVGPLTGWRSGLSTSSSWMVSRLLQTTWRVGLSRGIKSLLEAVILSLENSFRVTRSVR
jgi:hypothetical protein